MSFKSVSAPGLGLHLFRRGANPVVRRVQAGWGRRVALALLLLAVFVVGVCFCFAPSVLLSVASGSSV